MDIIKMLEAEQLRNDLPEFAVGDNVQVHYKVVEGTRERIQVLKELSSKSKEAVQERPLL